MKYPKMPAFNELTSLIDLYAQLKTEYGAAGVGPVLKRAERALRSCLRDLEQLPPDPALGAKEPNDLARIRGRRPNGPRRLWARFDADAYRDRIGGALIGRMAGCTLGAPVESWPVDRMQRLAEENNDPFPPSDYWTSIPFPAETRYRVSRNDAYTRDLMNGVPVDDDIVYMLLGLLIAEAYGPDFTTADVAEAWLQYLPYAYCAIEIALKNLKAGCAPHRAGERHNPYCDGIGGSIRADPWAYVAPGWPERAAEMAYRDAFLSHRRQGLYGAMFFAAAISAAFAVNDPVEALRVGLSEIPKDCAMAKTVRWALRISPRIHDYGDARRAVDGRFSGMYPAHILNNACLTVWGITIGGTDFSRVIGETVAMGLDNDCTAATAGSLVGAVIGADGIPAHWSARFDNTVHSYLVGRRRFTISGLVRRFARQARIVHTGARAT
ncbi:MAG: ADP-ribosylglycohydrolase family protein [Lentisphaerae bacterium]|nr:ADP-ribosylglycohydrolase family protein [Lentisphaerota bacterium]